MINDYRGALFHDDPRQHVHVAGRVEYTDGGAASPASPAGDTTSPPSFGGGAEVISGLGENLTALPATTLRQYYRAGRITGNEWAAALQAKNPDWTPDQVATEIGRQLQVGLSTAKNVVAGTLSSSEAAQVTQTKEGINIPPINGAEAMFTQPQGPAAPGSVDAALQQLGQQPDTVIGNPPGGGVDRSGDQSVADSQGKKPYSFNEARSFVENGIWTREQYIDYVERWEPDAFRRQLELAKLPGREPSLADTLGASPTGFFVGEGGEGFGVDSTFMPPSGNTFDIQNAFGRDPATGFHEGIGRSVNPVTGRLTATTFDPAGSMGPMRGSQIANILKARGVRFNPGATFEELANALDADLRFQRFFQTVNPDAQNASDFQAARNALFGTSEFLDPTTGQIKDFVDPLAVSEFVSGLDTAPALADGGSGTVGGFDPRTADERERGLSRGSAHTRFMQNAMSRRERELQAIARREAAEREATRQAQSRQLTLHPAAFLDAFGNPQFTIPEEPVVEAPKIQPSFADPNPFAFPFANGPILFDIEALMAATTPAEQQAAVIPQLAEGGSGVVGDEVDNPIGATGDVTTVTRGGGTHTVSNPTRSVSPALAAQRARQAAAAQAAATPVPVSTITPPSFTGGAGMADTNVFIPTHVFAPPPPPHMRARQAEFVRLANGTAQIILPNGQVIPLPAGTQEDDPLVQMWLGSTPAFANGGEFATDEPIVAVGMETGEPQFIAGEAGPERIDVTPIGSGRGGASVQRPAPKRADVLRAVAAMTRRRVNLAIPG